MLPGVISRANSGSTLCCFKKPTQTLKNWMKAHLFGVKSEEVVHGSGIYAEKLPIKPFPFNNNFSSAVVAAEVEVNPDLSLIIISLYALMETIGGQAWSIPNLHRMFSDLTETLSFSQTKHRIIIGGDFNASLQFDVTASNQSHSVFFDHLHEFGLHNCYSDYFDDFVQTHRHSRSRKPWQLDYFFISNRLKRSLIDCRVTDNEQVRQFSDHNPVVITLNL